MRTQWMKYVTLYLYRWRVFLLNKKFHLIDQKGRDLCIKRISCPHFVDICNMSGRKKEVCIFWDSCFFPPLSWQTIYKFIYQK